MSRIQQHVVEDNGLVVVHYLEGLIYHTSWYHGIRRSRQVQSHAYTVMCHCQVFRGKHHDFLRLSGKTSIFEGGSAGEASGPRSWWRWARWEEAERLGHQL